MKKPKIVGFAMIKEEKFPVVEATKPLNVLLRKEHIQEGKLRSFSDCGFAKAIGAENLWVFHHVIYVEFPNEGGERMVTRYKASSAVARAIDAFDNGERVKPGLYTLNVPSKSETLEHKREYAAKRKDRPSLTPLSGISTTKKHQKTNRNTRSGSGYVKFISKKK